MWDIYTIGVIGDVVDMLLRYLNYNLSSYQNFSRSRCCNNRKLDTLWIFNFYFTQACFVDHPPFPECAAGACLNGATCFQTALGPVCECAMGWEGDRCEIGKFITPVFQLLTEYFI